ncbi:hypothetical protein mRhiFer1_009511 [Rhinolophus ferrumequinum]|uniref:Uncharacterized protein n=1 Tax=Rhinolophus ferrumequinum TaxID=59479 RepID=A0A7J7RAW9_RHIFE|nr:hypothetical protein mRhiFer1_009511 [Rhinolophus ferrumequinum]
MDGAKRVITFQPEEPTGDLCTRDWRCAHTSSVDASSPQSPVRSSRIPKAMEVLHGRSSAALLRWEENITLKPWHMYQASCDEAEDSTFDWENHQEGSTPEGRYGDIIQLKGKTQSQSSSFTSFNMEPPLSRWLYGMDGGQHISDEKQENPGYGMYLPTKRHSHTPVLCDQSQEPGSLVVLALENSTSHSFIKKVSLEEWNSKTKPKEYGDTKNDCRLKHC